MSLYLIFAVCFWIAATLEAGVNRRLKVLEFSALIFFILFAGLRFETGFDWMAYLSYFEGVPDLGTAIGDSDGLGVFAPMEPLYGLLNSLIRSLGLNFQFLLFSTVLFNSLVLVYFLRKYALHPLLCLAVYFCLLYLSLQMAMIRQSMAFSFVLIGLDYMLRGRLIAYYVAVLIGVGFQSSVAIFLFVGPLLTRRTLGTHTLPILGIGLVVYCSGVNLASYALALLKFVAIGYLHDKIQFYDTQGLGNIEKSVASVFYVLINIVFVLYCWFKLNSQMPVVSRRAPSNEFATNSNAATRPFEGRGNAKILVKNRSAGLDSSDRFTLVIFNLCLILVVLQLYLSHFPLLWIRIQGIAVVAQCCALSRLMGVFRHSARLVACSFAGVIAIAIFTYQLTGPRMGPFFPYQSYVTYLWTGEVGTGRERAEYFMREYEYDFRQQAK